MNTIREGLKLIYYHLNKFLTAHLKFYIIIIYSVVFVLELFIQSRINRIIIEFIFE